MNIIDSFTEIFSYSFMVKAVLAIIPISIGAPLIGQFITPKNYSNITDSLAHISIIGVAIAVLERQDSFIYLLLTTVTSAIAIEYIRQKSLLKGESVLVLFTVGSLSITSIVEQKITFQPSLESVLFGSILNVTYTDIWIIFLICITIILFIHTNYNKLISLSLNEELAATQGIKVQLYNYTLILLAACIIAVSLEIIGGLLISSIMILPVLSARQFKQSFKNTCVLSVLFSTISSLTGLVVSWYMDLPSGAAISLVSVVFFIISFVLKKS